jgi:hypothetical protein
LEVYSTAVACVSLPHPMFPGASSLPVGRVGAAFGATAAVFGANALVGALRAALSTPPHPLVAARPRVAAHESLACVLTEIAPAAGEALLSELLDDAEEVLSLDERGADGKGANAWLLSRRCGDIVRKVRCIRVPASGGDDALGALLALRDDHLPQLIGILDDIVHNHLLRAGGV